MKIVSLFLLFILLMGCTTAPRIDKSFTSRSQSERIKFIIIHYTFGNLDRSLETLTKNEVSSHYLLTDTDKPFFYKLVAESQQANHAGLSSWKIYNQLNAASIGIEIVNLGFIDTPDGRAWYPYPQDQIDQLILLLKQLVVRYDIKPENILGHSEIAPQRKQDPGPMFPWKQLADAGLISWPDQTRVSVLIPQYQIQPPDIAWFQHKLSQHGYAVPQTGELDQETRNVLIAFQSRYRQSLFNGIPDAETAAILEVTTSILPPPLTSE
jgi:N-acetylmuramoyl-L-alanine amidase